MPILLLLLLQHIHIGHTIHFHHHHLDVKELYFCYSCLFYSGRFILIACELVESKKIEGQDKPEIVLEGK